MQKNSSAKIYISIISALRGISTAICYTQLHIFVFFCQSFNEMCVSGILIVLFDCVSLHCIYIFAVFPVFCGFQRSAEAFLPPLCKPTQSTPFLICSGIFFDRFFIEDLRFLSCIFNWVVCWGFVWFDRCNCCEKQSEVSFSGFTILSPIPLCFDIDRRFRGNFGDDGSEGVVCPNTKRPPIIRRLWAERFDIWWRDDNCGRW